MQTYPEKISEEKSSKKRHRVLFKELCSDFLKNTTLHGLKYANESGRTIVEKTFWLVFFVASVAYCGYQIRNVWTKWSERPVIVTFSEKMVPVGMVPFPSVTICPQRKISQAKYNFSAMCKQSDTLEKDQAYKLDDIVMLCESCFQHLPTHRNSANETLVQNILEATPDISDVLYACKWRGKFAYCNELFNEVLTNQGVCYNFNSISANEMFHENSIQHKYSYLNTTANTTGWSLEDGEDDEKDPYPRRGRPNGANPDLLVILTSPEEDDLYCNPLSDGFKIYVHHPTDFPQATLYSYAALFDQLTSLALKFNKISTSDAMYAYSPEVRQCYFQEDKPLKYFKVYTQHNCVLECSANHTFRECGCVGYYMPHDNSKEICPNYKHICIEEAIDKMAALELRNGGECSCLPACDSITYDAEILKTKFNFDRYLKSLAKLFAFEVTETSAIELYFKQPQFVSMRRSELFGVTDFISNCGGLLSLFLGFSILSLVEIVYYFTLRFFCILRKDSKRSCEENGNKEIEKQN